MIHFETINPWRCRRLKLRGSKNLDKIEERSLESFLFLFEQVDAHFSTSGRFYAGLACTAFTTMQRFASGGIVSSVVVHRGLNNLTINLTAGDVTVACGLNIVSGDSHMIPRDYRCVIPNVHIDDLLPLFEVSMAVSTLEEL